MHPEGVDITVLVIEGCPNTEVAEQNLRTAMDLAGRDVRVVVRTVTTETEAALLGFAGSPTILVDGDDPFPGDAAGGLACRLFATPEGPRGAPSVDQLVEVLQRDATRTG